MSAQECYVPFGILKYYFIPHAVSAECHSILSSNPVPDAISFWTYLGIFGLTCVLESPFYLLAFKGSRRSFLSKISSIIILNLATHPVVCFVFPKWVEWVGGNYAHWITLSEVFAPLVEGVLLVWIWKIAFKKSFLISIAANFFSWWIGALSSILFLSNA